MNEAPVRDPAPYASLTARSTTPARALLRAFVAACGAVAAALALVAVLVAVQGGSVDLRHADALMVVGAPCDAASAGDCATPAVLDHAIDLFRRGYASRVLLAANNSEAARDHLLAAGIPAGALVTPDAAVTPWQRARAAAAALRADGLQSVLLVGQPSDMLLALKMTRDLGLTVYPAPGAGTARIPSIGVLLNEALSYWRYVLLGE
jgi:uncharacterized SAM-binding protein YcdF (DUF218 family)